LSRPLLRGLLVMSAKLHFAENSLPLHLLLKGLQGLIDIVIANEYLHGLSCVLRPSLERSEDCVNHIRAALWSERVKLTRPLPEAPFFVQSAEAPAIDGQSRRTPRPRCRSPRYRAAVPGGARTGASVERGRHEWTPSPNSSEIIPAATLHSLRSACFCAAAM